MQSPVPDSQTCGAIMGGGHNVALILAPRDGADRVRVTRENPQAFGSLRVPEPNIARAGKEPTLVRIPCQRLHMRSLCINQFDAISRADVPEPDGPIPPS